MNTILYYTILYYTILYYTLLYYCSITKEFWLDVQKWITAMGFLDLKLSLRKIVVGELENSSGTNRNILVSKKINYNTENGNKNENTTTV